MTDDQKNYKLLIAYDGTNYCGWQVQPNGVSIQEVIQDKLAILLRSPVILIGSGRTDSGVHAIGQVGNFFSRPIDDLHKFLYSLNALLPDDIRIRSIEEAHANFHAQHSPIAKTYHYHLTLDRVQTPFVRLYALHVKMKMDLHLLSQAAKLFVGKHDFTSFANQAHLGSAALDPVRMLYKLDIIEEEGGIRLEFEGDGFLYKMVRNIVGTLLEVATGKRTIDDIPKLFEKKDRKLAGQAAPAHGLFLMHVSYPEVITNLATYHQE